MARKRLRQIKVYLTLLSIQPGRELRDQTVCLSPGLVTMPSRLPFIDESAPSILAHGLFCASDFLPNISDILDRLGTAQYFSIFDLASGFHQIELNPNDRQKTAFSSLNGHL